MLGPSGHFDLKSRFNSRLGYMSGEQSKDGVRKNRERLAQFYGGEGAESATSSSTTTASNSMAAAAAVAT